MRIYDSTLNNRRSRIFSGWFFLWLTELKHFSYSFLNLIVNEMNRLYIYYTSIQWQWIRRQCYATVVFFFISRFLVSVCLTSINVLQRQNFSIIVFRRHSYKPKGHRCSTINMISVEQIHSIFKEIMTTRMTINCEGERLYTFFLFIENINHWYNAFVAPYNNHRISCRVNQTNKEHVNSQNKDFD